MLYNFFNAMLRILYVVNTNVFHILPLFKSKCCPLKLVGVIMYGWHITRKVKLFAKKVKLREKKLRLSQKKDKRLPSFSCRIIISFTNRHMDRLKVKTEGSNIMYIHRYIYYLNNVIIDGPIKEVIDLSVV